MGKRKQKRSTRNLARTRMRAYLQEVQGEFQLTQQEVAARVGMAPQYLSDMKSGRRRVTELVARRLVDKFGGDYRWLLGQTPEGQGPPLKPRYRETPAGQHFHGIFPFPEHCGQQMRLLGNWSLHVLHYQCEKCFIRLQIKASFKLVKPSEIQLDPEMRDLIDTTP